MPQVEEVGPRLGASLPGPAVYIRMNDTVRYLKRRAMIWWHHMISYHTSYHIQKYDAPLQYHLAFSFTYTYKISFVYWWCTYKKTFNALILIRHAYIKYFITSYKILFVNINSILFSKKQHTQKPPSPFYYAYHLNLSWKLCDSYGIIQSPVKYKIMSHYI